MPRQTPTLSPSALNRFLSCEYRTYLDLLDRCGQLDAKRRAPSMELLMERGQRHEAAVVEGLRAHGQDVVSLDDPMKPVAERAAQTLAAMQAGRDVIHQGCFASGDWVGYPDFLVKVDVPSALGAWSYEVHDAKLGRSAKPAHVFQLLFYTDELERLQGVRPSRMHVILGDETTTELLPEDFSAYTERVRERFVERSLELEAKAAPAYPYPVAACDFCPWWHVCRDKRRQDDHLSLVANLHRAQGHKLEQAGVHSVEQLGTLADDVTVPRLAADTLANLRAQAALQLRSRGLDTPLVEYLRPEHDRGLGRLPAPSEGDVHFDFEGDPMWGEDGLEYLFGTVYEEDGEPRYWPLWAHDRTGEKAALEQWIDWLMARLERFPDLHVYHYNAYETTALKRLATRHATRELELDELLRRKVFVDLYGITRQAVRAGVESYGLKAMEAVYGYTRSQALDAVGSLRRWQRYLDDGKTKWLDEIAVYNEDDCRSTRALYAWLLALRPDVEAEFDLQLAQLAPEPPKPPSDRQLELQRRTDALRPHLVGDLPDDESQDTLNQRARRLAFALTGYHTREAKPAWWAYFERRTKTDEQLREDPEAIGGLQVVATDSTKHAWRWTCTFPAQEHKLGPGNVDDPLLEKSATIESLDDATRTLVVRRSKKHGEVAPSALAPDGPYRVDRQIDSVFAFAQRIADEGLDRAESELDLLLRRAPRLRPGTPPLAAGPVQLDRLAQQVQGLDRSALVIQGPPGTGKTYTGARVALRLMQRGLRVGVMATSHKAINNFLAAVDEAADEDERYDFRGWRKRASGGDEDNYASARIACSETLDESEGPVRLHAATAWWWSRDEAAGSVDVLFIDEAGQVSLADAIAVASGAQSLVLLGDPQQLAHVSQGTHPIGSGVSVLEHMLAGEDTVPADRGVFLNVSWRMHRDLCDFVSEAMYDRRLTSEPRCGRQRIHAAGALQGTGLRMISVAHEDNRGRSAEEAERIAAEVDDLLAGGRFTDRDGATRPLTLDDILIVAPYNAQVRCLRSVLPPGARVGTVDKFQGQEAPVVFFSMASSTGDDVARGMSFLFSRNRLNVAISRAQALAVVVCSPSLLRAHCSTVEDMRLVNLLCRVDDEASRFAVKAEPHITREAA